MQSNRLFRSSLMNIALVLTSALTFRCASDSGGGEQSEAVRGEAGQEGQKAQANNASLNGEGGGNEGAAQGESMNNAVEGGSTENFGAANGGNAGAAGGNTGGNAALGESLNNVPLENPSPLEATSNPALNSATPLAETPALNAAATTPASETPPTNSATPAVNPEIPQTASAAANTQPAAGSQGENPARAAASPFTNPHMNWPGKGKVKYVTRQLTRHSAPNGPVVGEFEEGEHPLVFQNGNWAELNDGSYVKGNGLSEKGVGYNKGKANWK